MFQLEIKLSFSRLHCEAPEPRLDLTGIKAVHPACRLLQYALEIALDCRNRVRLGGESHQLRMMPIADGLSPKHFPGKERFPPQGNESPRVQILRMERPQTHEWRPLPAMRIEPGQKIVHHFRPVGLMQSFMPGALVEPGGHILDAVSPVAVSQSRDGFCELADRVQCA